MSSTHILVFSHEHGDLLGAMYDLNVRSKSSPRIDTFLSAASAVVRQQIESLASPECARIGSFEDLVDLAEQFVKQDHPSVVGEIVLFTTVQIGQLLMYVFTVEQSGGGADAKTHPIALQRPILQSSVVLPATMCCLLDLVLDRLQHPLPPLWQAQTL